MVPRRKSTAIPALISPVHRATASVLNDETSRPYWMCVWKDCMMCFIKQVCYLFPKCQIQIHFNSTHQIVHVSSRQHVRPHVGVLVKQGVQQ